MFKKIFLNQIAAILELANMATLKQKYQRWKHTWHYWVQIDKGFPQFCMLVTEKLRGGGHIEAEIWGMLLY